MSGTADLVAAFAGGGGTANDSYNRELARLTAAKSAQALMDKRVAEAAMATTKNDQFQGIPNLEGIDPRMAALIQSGTATEWSAGQQGIGREQDNKLQRMGMEVAKQFKDSGANPADILNMLNAAQGQMLGPGNVRTADQADADIGYTNAATGKQLAETFAATMLGGERQAKMTKTGIEINNLIAEGIPGLEVPDTKTIDLLFPPGVDDDGEYVENPDASRFLRWYPNAAKTNPAYKNLMAAYNEFKKRKDLLPKASGEERSGAAAQTRRNRRLIYDADTGAFHEAGNG